MALLGRLAQRLNRDGIRVAKRVGNQNPKSKRALEMLEETKEQLTHLEERLELLRRRL